MKCSASFPKCQLEINNCNFMKKKKVPQIIRGKEK